MTMMTMTKVRNYIPGETLPPALATGFEKSQCDPQWIFVAVDGSGSPVAILVAAPAHVAVILLRLVVLDSASPSVAGTLLRQVLAECATRGYLTYLTWLNPQRPHESSLLSLIRQTGGIQLTEPQVACVGLTAGRVVDAINVAEAFPCPN